MGSSAGRSDMSNVCDSLSAVGLFWMANFLGLTEKFGADSHAFNPEVGGAAFPRKVIDGLGRFKSLGTLAALVGIAATLNSESKMHALHMMERTMVG